MELQQGLAGASGLLIGMVSLPGAFVARAFVERLPLHVHTAILNGIVVLGGLLMYFRLSDSFGDRWTSCRALPTSPCGSSSWSPPWRCSRPSSAA